MSIIGQQLKDEAFDPVDHNSKLPVDTRAALEQAYRRAALTQICRKVARDSVYGLTEAPVTLPETNP